MKRFHTLRVVSVFGLKKSFIYKNTFVDFLLMEDMKGNLYLGEHRELRPDTLSCLEGPQYENTYFTIAANKFSSLNKDLSSFARSQNVPDLDTLTDLGEVFIRELA